MSFALLPVALALAASEGPPPSVSNPVETFLHAADINDFVAMEAVMDRGSSKFITKISNCYLRRVYSNEQAHEILAAWMCAEGPNRSRVVLASIHPIGDSKVSVSVQQENTNQRPAPERTGSAFAD